MATEEDQPTGPDLAEGIAAADLPDGSMIEGHVGKDAVLLARVGDRIFAIGALCSHYHGHLAEGLLDGDTVHCPLHHACFSLRTGEALKAPAFDNVGTWRVERDGDRIRVGEKLPKPAIPAVPAPDPGAGRFVIVGGGAAGFAAAERLRREGFQGKLTILSAEADRPIDRPNLSKDNLAGQAPESWLYLKPASFFERRGIALELGASVAAIDPRNRTVALADGRSLPFEKLLLATGAEPVRLAIPGADLPHVFTLRALPDLRAIVARVEAGRTAVVVGASFIGLEVAASLNARGLAVHVVAPDERPLARILGNEIGDFVRAEHERHGVVFHLGRKPAAIEEGAVVLDDGVRLAADLVVTGVGVRPRTALAEAAGLRIDRGVLVDGRLETGAPGIFAAGDIARYPYPAAADGTARIEHWVVAERMGQAAAFNMLGRAAPFRDVPCFWSQHYGATIDYVGHADRWDRTEVSGDIAAGDGEVRYLRGGRLLAVATLGRDALRAERALELELGGG
jgi:NADPH-dependent 2,4-dienoyl-CoA reductase/sulfur reductase-like enzyme/nitrite reductase/ring-hydroxylating ferredoxin subunit